MERTRQLTTFAIDGYQISATFADSRNTTALGHVKQILLSSFANNAAKHTPGDILAIHPNRSDNNSGGKLGYRARSGKMWHHASIRGIICNLTYLMISLCNTGLMTSISIAIARCYLLICSKKFLSI